MMKQRTDKKVGILGYGEVGKAISGFYGSANSPQVKIKDLNRDDGLEGVEILHVCLPWSNNFVKIVKKEIKKIKPKLTIIHSTVAPGTTKKIGGAVVHSPIRGMHPNLYPGVKTFLKYIGADNKKAGMMAESHLESLGIRTKVFRASTTTEIGKLLDTTYYGLVIAWHGEMKKMCQKYKINFDEAVTDFNQSYNEGYKKLGKKNVIRPVLYPPKGAITGHCIISNAKILKKYFRSETLNLILKYKSKNQKAQK